MKNVGKNRDLISSVFSSVAKKYDIMNDLMSFGMHRLWKKRFVDLITVKENAVFTDLSCGTGDIARLILKKNSVKLSTLIDPDEKMLALAKENLLNNGISLGNIEFKSCLAESLDLSEKSQDFITISFGARNFSDLKKGLENCRKAICDGGYLYIMEFTPSMKNQSLDKVYQKYLTHVLPKIGKFVAKDEAAYSYLASSIKEFLEPREMKKMLLESGFSYVDYIAFANGAVGVYIARV
ncbi:ubiquinone/menaquinone biosynthesis methyltransferase [Candidatus Deianiraea vastatrix]|uniref:Ubiquinone/menaquinone biosynthesis C-methyltransferase UbiE n=1 Tax=Candidatus Deianiraea vastatrix TaxID=2163644 RepID=A0A5B8XE50_9RICK|nr:ubiquinone/menaquinone biosynthesis methyltransferase [Candidatus Deianiraea vastatrix]QED23543.1 Ubiquinone/menaquinone biosynthesis C-methyltransferase UbiE [Candidatus Deianiraea vastatrix]